MQQLVKAPQLSPILQTIAKTENGKFLINHAGTPSATNFGGVATFIAQNQTLDDSGLTVSDENLSALATFKQIDSARIRIRTVVQRLCNHTSLGSVQTGSNATSVAKYGTRTLQRTVLSDATEANDQGIYFIGLMTNQLFEFASCHQSDMATTADAEKILHLNVHCH